MNGETYGPPLGGIVTIASPGHDHDGKQARVAAVILRNNTAHVLVMVGRTQWLVRGLPWSELRIGAELMDTPQRLAIHGSKMRHSHGCRCSRCVSVATGRKPKRPAVHGTRYSYKTGCRCLECMDAAAQYMREYRAEKRQGQV